MKLSLEQRQFSVPVGTPIASVAALKGLFADGAAEPENEGLAIVGLVGAGGRFPLATDPMSAVLGVGEGLAA